MKNEIMLERKSYTWLVGYIQKRTTYEFQYNFHASFVEIERLKVLKNQLQARKPRIYLQTFPQFFNNGRC